MRNIHSLLVFCLVLATSSQMTIAQPAVAPAVPAPAIAAPIAPVLKGITGGGYIVIGTAQKPTPAGYSTVAIFVCISQTKPASPPLPCDNPPTTAKSASLTNPAAIGGPQGDYVKVDANGNFSATLSTPVPAGQYVYVTQTAQSGGTSINSFSEPVSVTGTQCNKDPLNKPYSDCDLSLSLIAGAEQSAQSSLASEVTPFIRVFTRATTNPKSNFYVWGTVRLLGAPTTSSTLGIVSVVSDPSGSLSTQTFSTIGTSIDFSVGLEYEFRRSKKNMYSASIIAGGGETTPLQANTLALGFQAPPFGTVECAQLVPSNSSNRYAAQFKSDNILPGSAANTTGSTPACLVNGNSPTTTDNGTTFAPITTIGFTNQDRTSFFGKYAFGVRTIDRFPGSGNVACGDSDPANNIGPCERGIVDWTVGQDASITGGQMRNWVFKIDGIHPLPVPSVQFLYLFGSASIRLKRNSNFAPLVLQSTPLTTLTATDATGIPNVSTVVLPLVQPNRDYYRFGVGINVNQLFTKLFTAKTAN